MSTILTITKLTEKVMNVLNEDIKSGNFKSLYLLCGTEKFLVLSYKKRLKKAIVQDDMNYSFFEGKQIEEKELMDTIATLPFFAESRCIIVEGSNLFKSASDAFINFLDTIPKSSHVIFIEEEVDKKSKLYKKVKELGHIAVFDTVERRELRNWVIGFVKRYDKEISPYSAELILDYVGADMNRLSTELEKLISFAGDKGLIEKSDIDSIVSESLQNKIFEMINAIVVRNTDRAMDIYEDLLALKEAPLKLISLIAGQFHQLLSIKDMLADGIGKKEIGAKLKLAEYVLSKLVKQCQGFDRKRLYAYFNKCIELEYDVKRGLIGDRLALEIIIVGD